MKPEIEIKESRISLSMESIVFAMTLDQKRETLAWLASDPEVIRSVVQFINGEDEMGWSTGDPGLRQEILESVENTQIGSALRFNWKPWDEVRAKIRDIRAGEHIYWVLYHKIDPEVSRMVFEELRKIGVKSNYTSDIANKEIEEVKEYIEAAFKAMRKEDA